MKARVKMPPGSRDKSLRSSASSDITEIRVLLAICRRETPRFSRASRKRAPTVRDGGPWGIIWQPEYAIGVCERAARARAEKFSLKPMLGNHSARVKHPPQCRDDAFEVALDRYARRRNEQPDGGHAGGAGLRSRFSPTLVDSADGQHRQRRGSACARQLVDIRRRWSGGLRRRRKHRSKNQVVD